jgi:hypothetical protein
MSGQGVPSCPRIDGVLDERSRHGDESTGQSGGEPHRNGDCEDH